MNGRTKQHVSNRWKDNYLIERVENISQNVTNIVKYGSLRDKECRLWKCKSVRSWKEWEWWGAVMAKEVLKFLSMAERYEFTD